MNKRRSHNKSRKGCTNCKQRHVKCDEQGPPCAACVARDTTSTCVYGTRKSTTPSTPGSTDNELASLTSIPESIQDAERRLLELRLMHRWMTHTWKCCHGMDEDVEFLQELMPQASLKFSYLLYSMLSICAIDIAIHGEAKAFQTNDPMFYVETALHYFNLSSEALRLQLGKTDPEAHLWVYMASVVLTMIQMAIPQCLQTHAEGPQPTMIERMGVVIELFMGNGKVALLDPTALYASPGSAMMHKATALISGPPPEDISDTVKITMENMEAVVNSASSPDSELIFPAYHDSYVKVMGLLKLSFMEDARGQLKGMCVSVPMFCGREFCSAVNEAQPTALYLLMILGALVEKGARDGYWWANTIGSGLVQETSEILAKTQPHLMLVPEWQGGIAWARAEVGLPVLV